MEYSFKNIRWVRVINTALIAFAFSYFSLLLTTTVYAFILAFQIRGKPDQVAISQFAESVSKWLMPVFEILLTFISTLISTRKIEKDIPLNGLVIGIFVGIFGVILKMVYGGMVNYYTIALFLILGVCGYLSGFVTQRRKKRKLQSPAESL